MLLCSTFRAIIFLGANVSTFNQFLLRHLQLLLSSKLPCKASEIMYVQTNVPTNDVSGHWTTTPFECLKDEETCWWGSWCCCLLSARNAESFGVGNSKMQAWGFVTMICVSFLLFIFLPPLGLVCSIAGLIAYAYYKAEKRSKIRTLYEIPGTMFSDFMLHCVCPCCAVAQEGREAIAKSKKPIDFWYGEDLSAINFPQAGAGGYVPSSPTTHITEEGPEVGLLERLKNISLMSHLILRFWLAVVAATFISLIVMGRGISILVLILVFVQPFLILYFVYWRDPERNKHVSLDYVIKLFAVGFFMSTSQSIVFESILEGILGIATQILLLIFNPSMNDTDDTNSDNAAALLSKALMPIFHKEVNWGTLLSSAFTNTYMFLFSPSAYESTTHFATSVHSGAHLRDESGHVYYPQVAENRFLSDSSNSTDDSTFTPELMRKNFYIVVAALLVMAFVIAAGVEETMKHFAVRCCRFPAPLKDPKSVLIYLMTAALGFATSENIEYVFGTNRYIFYVDIDLVSYHKNG